MNFKSFTILISMFAASLADGSKYKATVELVTPASGTHEVIAAGVAPFKCKWDAEQIAALCEALIVAAASAVTESHKKYSLSDMQHCEHSNIAIRQHFKEDKYVVVTLKLDSKWYTAVGIYSYTLEVTNVNPDEDKMPVTEVNPDEDKTSVTEVNPNEDMKQVTEVNSDEEKTSVTEVNPDEDMQQVTEINPDEDKTPVTEVNPDEDKTPVTEVNPDEDKKQVTEVNPDADSFLDKID